MVYLCILLLFDAGLRNETLEQITVEWSATLYNGPYSLPSTFKRFRLDGEKTLTNRLSTEDNRHYHRHHLSLLSMSSSLSSLVVECTNLWEVTLVNWVTYARIISLKPESHLHHTGHFSSWGRICLMGTHGHNQSNRLYVDTSSLVSTWILRSIGVLFFLFGNGKISFILQTWK